MEKIGEVSGGKSGERFEVFWFSLDGESGHYEVRRKGHRDPLSPVRKKALTQSDALRMAQADVTER